MDHVRSSRVARSSLDAYLDAMGAHARLDADDERAFARRVVERRREYWRAFLSCPTRIDPVLEALGDATADEAMSALVAKVNAAQKRFASAPGAKVTKQLTTRCEALADALTAAGVDPTQVASALDMRGADPEYARRVRKARTAFHDARDRFVCANLRLVVALADRYGRHHMSLADRVQEGNLGLLKAVDRFDPERGVRFSTYAAWWIRHAITRALTNHGRVVRVPAHLQASFTKMRTARGRLRSVLGRDPTDDELAVELQTDVATLSRVRDAMQMRAVGLDAPLTAGGTSSLHDALADDDNADVADILDEQRNHTVATLAFRELEAKEQDILNHRFGLSDADSTTLQMLGDRYGVSRERIRQIQNRALAKLRRVVEASPTTSCAFAAA